MKFFTVKQLSQSWSVWVLSALAGLTTVDFSTTWLDGLIPTEYKPVVYAGLSFLGLVVRTIKQPKIK